MMSPYKTFLRKIPCARWCAMQYMMDQRRRQLRTSQAYIQSVLATLGNITIGWAGIELMLSHLVIWHHVKSGLVPEKGLPRMLSYQLDYLKKNIEKDSDLPRETREKIKEIRIEITELNKFRILITHGVLHQRNRWTTDWHTHSIKIDGNSWRVIRHTYTNDEVILKSKEISDLGHKISPFIAKIIGMSHPLNAI